MHQIAPPYSAVSRLGSIPCTRYTVPIERLLGLGDDDCKQKQRVGFQSSAHRFLRLPFRNAGHLRAQQKQLTQELLQPIDKAVWLSAASSQERIQPSNRRDELSAATSLISSNNLRIRRDKQEPHSARESYKNKIDSPIVNKSSNKFHYIIPHHKLNLVELQQRFILEDQQQEQLFSATQHDLSMHDTYRNKGDKKKERRRVNIHHRALSRLSEQIKDKDSLQLLCEVILMNREASKNPETYNEQSFGEILAKLQRQVDRKDNSAKHNHSQNVSVTRDSTHFASQFQSANKKYQSEELAKDLFADGHHAKFWKSTNKKRIRNRCSRQENSSPFSKNTMRDTQVEQDFSSTQYDPTPGQHIIRGWLGKSLPDQGDGGLNDKIPEEGQAFAPSTEWCKDPQARITQIPQKGHKRDKQQRARSETFQHAFPQWKTHQKTWLTQKIPEQSSINLTKRNIDYLIRKQKIVFEDHQNIPSSTVYTPAVKGPHSSHFFVKDMRDRFGKHEYPIIAPSNAPAPGQYQTNQQSIQERSRQIELRETQKKLVKMWLARDTEHESSQNACIQGE